jgi:hypothetical protein
MQKAWYLSENSNEKSPPFTLDKKIRGRYYIRVMGRLPHGAA